MYKKRALRIIECNVSSFLNAQVAQLGILHGVEGTVRIIDVEMMRNWNGCLIEDIKWLYIPA